MCVASMIYDHYWDKWSPLRPAPTWVPAEPIVVPTAPPLYPVVVPPAITPEEIAEFRRLMERAREYDKKHNQPDCELEEKRRKIKELADALGVEIGFV